MARICVKCLSNHPWTELMNMQQVTTLGEDSC